MQGIKTFIKRSIYVLIACLLFLLCLVWHFFIAPHLEKIPNTFSYSANILSLDNFYDEKIKKFEGQHISKTQFNYDVVAIKPSLLVIKNSFKVRTLSNKPIFSVDRLYYINPYTTQHVADGEPEHRTGFLFAPRHNAQQGFNYWHINYNAPAKMEFINQEKIEGLTVYHYQAHYESDQTANLKNLPGVPEKRGIRTQIILQLWVEPVSGWMVKYQDNTLAYYYDRKTGLELFPWNNFSNRYTVNSIRKEVKIATRLKWKIITIDYIVPGLLLTIAFLSLALGYIKHQKPDFSFTPLTNYLRHTHSRFLLSLISFLILITSSISVYYIFINKHLATMPTIGISQCGNNPDLIDAIRGFKDGLAEQGYVEGKNLNFILKNSHASIEHQMDIIQDFKHTKVDLIFTLTTPATLVAKGITKLTPIVFSDVTYPEQSGIVNSIKSSQDNVVGTRNYISPAQQFYQFDRIYPQTKTLGFIHHKGDPDSEILYQEFKKMLAKRHIEVLDIAALDLDDLRQQLNQPNQFNTLFLACDTLTQNGGGIYVAKFSRDKKIPSFSCEKDSILKGILVGYIADRYAIGKQAGRKAALILEGAQPSWLHTENPEEAQLIINLTTAKAIGITIPDTILQEAEYVVQQ